MNFHIKPCLHPVAFVKPNIYKVYTALGVCPTFQVLITDGQWDQILLGQKA